MYGNIILMAPSYLSCYEIDDIVTTAKKHKNAPYGQPQTQEAVDPNVNLTSIHVLNIVTSTRSEMVLTSSMEAVWNFEDKWKLTTQQAFLLFACTAFALIALCTATILLKKKRNQMANQHQHQHQPETIGSCSNWVKLRRKLRWSDANKWDHQKQLLDSNSRHSRTLSPVWQRPILMGEKCELPRFSGLILYDQTGCLLHHSLSSSLHHNIHQDKQTTVKRTTLKDLL